MPLTRKQKNALSMEAAITVIVIMLALVGWICYLSFTHTGEHVCNGHTGVSVTQNGKVTVNTADPGCK